MRKILWRGTLAVFFLALGFAFFFVVHFFLSRPGYSGKVSLEGLSESVRVIVDAWGVPHIDAANEEDLFRVCGYIQAKERMWQMELTRRSGHGTLAELFGPDFLEKDKFARVMGLREAAQKDYENLTDRMKELLLAYSQGVNAWLASRGWRWPPEFLILRHRPRPWTPLDSLMVKEVMALLLCTDFPSEVVRAALIDRLGVENALEILEEGVVPPSFPPERASLKAYLRVVFAQESNSWVLAGSRTESGKPLLANDPHLEIMVPPIWYEMHLRCPSFDVIGVTLPGVPGVVIGHNAFVAWGMTASAVDVQDLCIERFNDAGDMFWEGGRWLPLERKEELIWVKGRKQPEKIDVLWTSRGPVLSPHLIQSQNPISLRWTLHQGGRTVEALYLMNRARNTREFAEALRLFDVPSQNIVCADRDGNIGYFLSGRIPLRNPEAGLYPYPAWDKKGKWQGFLPEEAKPNRLNPEEGLIVTANNNLLPDAYPYYVGVDWDAPFRASRIRDLLLEKPVHSVSSLIEIQADVYAEKGRALAPFFSEMSVLPRDLEEAGGMLRAWNFQVNSGSAAALYEAFMNFLPEEVFRDELGEDFQAFDLLFRRKTAGVLRIARDPDSHWFDDKTTEDRETRADIVVRTLRRAYEGLRKTHGPPEEWDWSRMNAVRFPHALGRVPVLWFFNLKSSPQGGDAFTVKVNYRTQWETTWSASYRQIIDLSDWDRSVCVLTSGQSGHFMSRFYRNQKPLWVFGEYHPMAFSQEAVSAQAAGTLAFLPEKRKP
ncbi:MAG: penicillin acylase family protein [Candidatus Aminicenantales bacterium]